MSKCCICGREITDENAPVLFMSGFGNPRLVCSTCEEHIDVANNGCEPEKIEEACRALASDLEAHNTDETAVINAVGKILLSARDRKNAIEDGSYDFSSDESTTEEEEFDITEDLMETEEDRALDEAEKLRSDKLDKIISWISGIAFAGVAVYIILKFIFR